MLYMYMLFFKNSGPIQGKKQQVFEWSNPEVGGISQINHSALPLIWKNEFVATETSAKFVCGVLICSTYISGED